MRLAKGSILNIRLFVAVIVLLSSLTGNLRAGELTFGYGATLVVSDSDLQTVIGVNGQTFEDLFDELFGKDAVDTGEANLFGTFSWNTDVPPFVSNPRAAHYPNSIVGATVALGSASAQAVTNDIALNAQSSIVGHNTFPGPSCGSLAACNTLNVPFTPTGNLFTVFNDEDFTLIDFITGEPQAGFSRDAMSLALGLTDSSMNFTPTVPTIDFGQVAVRGVIFSFIATEDGSVKSSTAIPTVNTFPDFEDAESVTAGIVLSSDSFTSPSGQIAIPAQVTSFSLVDSLCNGLEVTVNLGLGQTPTSSDDVILGTPGPDIINALAGNDTICGEGGNDIINAGGGNDWIDAGPGNDRVLASAGDDMVFGGTGDDEILAGSGDDDVEGEEGDDTLFGQPGNDVLDGGDGVDAINGGGGSDMIFTGPGATVGTGRFVTGNVGNDTITGGPDADDLRGFNGLDTINGGGGDDVISGGDGRDTIDGGAGDDEIRGQNGVDVLSGGSGDDFINGGNDIDTINGGPGADEIIGGPGNDILNGDGGSDDIEGGSGDDEMAGGPGGGDSCNGQSGTDTADASCETVVGVP